MHLPYLSIVSLDESLATVSPNDDVYLHKSYYPVVFLHRRKKVRRGNNRCFCSCRIVSSLRSRMILPSVLFTREMSGWEDVATAARDGSSLSTERSAVVPCLLTQYCGSEIKRKTTTDPGSLRATVTTYTRAKSESESILEIVQDMETPMVSQAGIQCPV